jgi:hypothetical protein
MTFRTAGDQLTRAASAVWAQRTADPDPYDQMGYGADCGPIIEAGHRARALKAVTAAGYTTPGAYNADLRARMCPDGHVTLRVNDLLSVLELEACPRCGADITTTAHRTRNYGGGWDTTERCTACDYREVYV